MPPKKTLPRTAKRLPKGTNRHDYEPEVFEAWNRDRMRQRKARHRSLQRHRGYRDVTFALSKEARENLASVSKEVGMTRSTLLNTLLEHLNVQFLQAK